MHNFSFLDIEELTLEMLEDDIEELSHRQRDLMFVPNLVVDVGENKVETSGLVQIDQATGKISVGFADVQYENYAVYTDIRPAQEVFNFVKLYFDSGIQRFPHVSESRPIIPPSRYPKANEFFEVYDFFVSKNYRILHPSHMQKSRYPSMCDDQYNEKYNYIVNTKRDFYTEGINAVMLDFNPYYPDSARHIKSVTVVDKGVTYERYWKDKIISGKFDMRDRRYHFEIWSQIILLPRKRKEWVYINNYDLIVTNFNLVERFVKVRKKDGFFEGYKDPVVFSDNLYVEPYDVIGKPHKFRSNLRKSSFPGVMYVPWSNKRLKMVCERNLKGCDNDPDSVCDCRKGYVYTNNSTYMLSGREIDLSRLHSKVADMKTLSRQGLGKFDQQLIAFAEKVFVRYKWSSAYDGEHVRRDAHTKFEFDGAYILDGRGAHKFITVPYKISRYPNNGYSTLLPSLSVFSLEEFIYGWQKEFLKFKFPPWLPKLEEGTISVLENEYEVSDSFESCFSSETTSLVNSGIF